MSEAAANMVTPVIIIVVLLALAVCVYLCGLKTKITDVEE